MSDAALSVSIVTHNSADVIGTLLSSLFEHTATPLSVYVVDNGSTDDTVAKVQASFPNVTVLTQDNRGFGAGHNAVLPHLTSTYHAVVNPDIVLREDTLGVLCTYLDEHADVAMATPLILNPDGTRQDVPRVAPKRRYLLSRKLERFGGVFRRWRDEYTLRTATFDAPMDVTFCTGCFFVIRTDVFKALGGFDERFFLYCEDADLTRRALAHGRAVCLPQTSVIHAWERGSAHNLHLLRIHLSSLHKYFRKWRKG